MSVKKMIALIAVILTAINAQAHDFIEQNAKITYDKDNYVIFEDVGRKTDYTPEGKMASAAFGHFVRLHGLHDGKKFDANLINPNEQVDSPTFPLIWPTVIAIKYSDKDHVLIVSQAHASWMCVLYNLEKYRVDKSYYGDQIVISPDGSKVAIVTWYLRDATKRKTEYFAFVNDTMIFPFIESGFSVWEYSPSRVEDRIRKADGTNVDTFLSKKPAFSGHLVPEIRWDDKDRVIIDVKDRLDDTTATRHTISGLSDLGTSRTLKMKIRDSIDGIDTVSKSAGKY